MSKAYFDQIENVITRNLRSAKSSVKIAVAWITNQRLAAIVEEIKMKGVETTLIVADDKINFEVSKSIFHSLIDKGIEVRISSFPKLMHHKFCIIDTNILLVGSYNWTFSAELNNYENLIETSDKNLIHQFLEEFKSLSETTQKINSVTEVHSASYASSEINRIEWQLIKENTMNIAPLKKTTTQIPIEVQELLDEADSYYFNAEYTKAIELCNKINIQYSDIADTYEIIANCKWRQKKYQEQIKFATQAIELDRNFYSAYNTLGIGYSYIGNATKSIENYQICINAEPDNYIYYRNRALSYMDLERDFNVPKNFRDQSTLKADKDWKKVIELTDRAELNDKSYNLYYSRGVAKFHLNKLQGAKEDFLTAEKIYPTTPKKLQDIHIKREIRSYLKEIIDIQELKR